MFLVVEKIKISNFLSFFGVSEVNFKHFSAIMCNFYEGKDDFFRAFEFVLGADLVDLRVDNPLELVHKVLREEFLVSDEIKTYVEIVVSLPQEEKQHKFSRTVKIGPTSPRLEHKISDIITSSVHYKEKLQSLNLYIKEKNLVFYKNYFNNAIWGSSEDLEMTLSACLRESFTLEEWKRAKKEVDRLKFLKQRMAEKHYNSIRNSHLVISRHTKNYETILAHRESLKKEILRHFLPNGDSSSDESSPSQNDSKDGDISNEDFKETTKTIESLEIKIENLKHKLHILRIREAPLISALHYEEIKLAAKPVNASILQNRLSQVKLHIREKENQMSEIWGKILELKSEGERIGEKISESLVALKEMEGKKYLQNRITTYGRLSDYLQPSSHVELLRQIIGADLFNANLCDSNKEAVRSMDFMNNLKYENREVFIPFENFSHKLKDVLTASGEKGIHINTLEELLIFLCKLKYFDLIDEVPVIIPRQFDFQYCVSDNYLIYVQNNVHLTNDGLISYKVEEYKFCMESEKQLRKDILQLQAQQEINYQKINDLFYLRYQTLVELSSSENDYFNLKQNWKKTAHRSHPAMKPPQISEIYEEYSETFKHYVEGWQKYESEVQQGEESFLEEGDSSASSTESLQYIVTELEDVAAEKVKIISHLESLTEELRALYSTWSNAQLPEKYVIKFQNNIDKKKIFFEKEFRKLQKLMGEDELLNFLGQQEWRKNLISSLIKDFDKIKTKLEVSSERLQSIAVLRKRKLYPLFEHCSRYLSATFNSLLGDALPFVDINFFHGEEKIHIMSSLGTDKVNIVDIKHFNTFLKFACTLSIFLEISKFENIPVVVFDDMEEFFPNDDDDLDSLMDSSTLEKLIPDNTNRKFYLLLRIGQFLQHYIKKNSPGNRIRNNGRSKDYTSGPTQIIYFSSGDLIHAAEHYIWIQNQILPDEYISENCNSFSLIHEINFDD